MQFDVDTVSEGVANLKVGDQEDLERKIFIGGLSWLTTEEALSQYFENLGMSVESVVIMRDKVANRSRGFGFVTLKNIEDVDKAVRLNHHLDGRKIEAKKSIPKWDMENTSKKNIRRRNSNKFIECRFPKIFRKFRNSLRDPSDDGSRNRTFERVWFCYL